MHQFLDARGIHSKNERIKEISGAARWLRTLETPNLSEECKDVAKLWGLRNDIVHEQKVFSENENRIVTSGIKSLESLRNFFLQTIDPDLLKKEKMFASFLEGIPLGTAEREPIDGLAPITFGWRREKDHYEKAINPQNTTNGEQTSES